MLPLQLRRLEAVRRRAAAVAVCTTSAQSCQLQHSCHHVYTIALLHMEQPLTSTPSTTS